ncbi:periplasmic heavy metal sensor [bacterium]|nr:periplasmic heavy metal sensor [bacterium]
MNRTLLIVFLLALTAPLFAQRGNLSPDERRDRLEAVIIGKFATELELSSEQAEKFFPLLRAFRAETSSAQDELQEARRELNSISQSSDADSKQVKDLIARTNSLQAMLLEKRSKFLTDLADVLTPQQVSRCAILLDELPRKMREFMEERRGQGGGGQHKGGPPANRRGY